eukprot:CAMPEP_0181344580 /NCGR_PEP_ID=MMETSP1101-20121128/32249_1 /TAXON_ID=46948 /ORGANISM="Rhodomonas abbreviata, Strain Caron Lab Isolate" /LENGTH=442 /DNA_ID=CAMNT_0023456393 /DNA_START=173 /DNA_END=1501 /DNA_ORIENTATION=-
MADGADPNIAMQQAMVQLLQQQQQQMQAVNDQIQATQDAANLSAQAFAQQLQQAQMQANQNAQAVQMLQQQLINQHHAPNPEDKINGRTDPDTKVAQFAAKNQGYLSDRNIPRANFTKHASRCLKGDAAVWWQGFANPTNGVTADEAMDWDEFKTALLAYAYSDSDVDAIKTQFVTLSDGLRDEGGELKPVNDKWNEWLLRYRSTPALANYYSEGAIIDQYTLAMRGVIQGNLSTNRPATIDAAMTQANRIYASLPKRKFTAAGAAGGGGTQRNRGGGRGNALYGMGGGTPGGSPAASRLQSRAGTPSPNLNSLQKALTSLQSDLAALSTGFGSGRGRGRGSGQGGGGAPRKRKRFYTPDDPPPEMTPVERRWCLDNKACFACREAHADHRQEGCKRFGRQLGSLNDAGPGWEYEDEELEQEETRSTDFSALSRADTPAPLN